MPQVPTLVGRVLASQAESRAGCGGRISLLIPFLLVLKSSQDPTCLALLEFSILVTLDGEHPATRDKIIDIFEFPHIEEIKKLRGLANSCTQPFLLGKIPWQTDVVHP